MKRVTAALLAVVTALILSMPPRGWALLIPSQAAALSASSKEDLVKARSEDMRSVQRALESKIVRARLARYGLSPREIEPKLAKLSDAQLHELARHADQIQPGGDDASNTLITLGAIVVLILLIVYLIKRI